MRDPIKEKNVATMKMVWLCAARQALRDMLQLR
jgi:hypothetical protein